MTTLTLERIVPAPPRAVFEAWLDPTALARFMCPAAGSRVGAVEVDARVGGAFLIVMLIGDTERPHRGEYLEITPHSRLAFTWRSHAAGEGSRVTLRFEPLGDDQTRLTLEHVGLDGIEARRQHDLGWTAILGALAAAV
jgi:uncharacterized protein YndB with AHSA1/START domain